MNVNNITLLLIASIIISCGPNAEQQAAAQKQREDSIRFVTKARVENIGLLKDSIASIEAQKEGMENRLTVLQADLEAAKDKMNSIKEFQVLRSAVEREEQVRSQFLVIEEIEKEIKDVNHEINEHATNLVFLKGKIVELESNL